VRVAHLLEDYARRAGDMAARFGGEEFALILPDTESEYAKDIAEHVRMTLIDLKLPHSASQVTNIVTASFGVYTMVPDRDAQPETLIDYADKALYQAKDRGRNMVVLYNESSENKN
jgi:diguanylate cyclase (GGDEF)-like protein